MFGRSKELVAPAVPSWSGAGVSARWTTVPAGLRGRSQAPAVEIAAGGGTSRYLLASLRDVVDGRTGVADGTGTPQTFLARVGAYGADTPAGDLTRGLPDGALALLVAPMDAAPAAVLSGRDLEAFEEWVRGLG